MLILNNSIYCIDTHTAGEPTRIIISGFPLFPGTSAREYFNLASQYLDPFRKTLMLEPRGHKAMFGAFLVPSTRADCQYGVIFCDWENFLPMCGHASIAIAHVLITLGMVPKIEPITTLSLDTPAGIVTLKLDFTQSATNPRITLQNVPAFVFKTDVVLNVKNFEGQETLVGDLCYAGNYFVIIDLAAFDIFIEATNVVKLKKLGIQIIKKIRKDPDNFYYRKQPVIDSDYLVMFYNSKDNSAKNLVIFDGGQIDRSPCGTGTSAKMALFASQGKLNTGATFISESLNGQRFEGTVEFGEKLDGIQYYVPYITGTAFITAFSQFTIEQGDPFAHGFTF